MTPTQRKDYLANCFLKRGINKTSIIAMLNNAYTESAHTFDPKIVQYGGGAGRGIFQWSNGWDSNQIYSYARSHSEKEAIEMQANFLIDHPGQWIPRGSGMSWDDFLHNTKNKSWQDMTYWFCWCWERPADPGQARARINNYNLITPIHWDGNAPDGGNGNNKPQENTDKKAFRFGDCRSLLNKNKGNSTDHQPDASQGGGGGGTSAGFNAQPCLDYYRRNQPHLYYSMPRRGGVYSGVSSDCSAFVSYMLELGYGLSTRTLYNTETLHAFLLGLGYHCVEQRASSHTSTTYKTGDVIIMGRKGSSLGANGHTSICLASPKIYDCSASGKSGRALSEYANAQEFLSWHFYGNPSPYFYHYTK